MKRPGAVTAEPHVKANGAAAPPHAQPHMLNAALYKTIAGAEARILGWFEGIATTTPLGFTPDADGLIANISPYDRDTFFKAMATSGEYICGGNMWWLRRGYSVLTGVPLIESNITELQKDKFSAPRF